MLKSTISGEWSQLDRGRQERKSSYNQSTSLTSPCNNLPGKLVADFLIDSAVVVGNKANKRFIYRIYLECKTIDLLNKFIKFFETILGKNLNGFYTATQSAQSAFMIPISVCIENLKSTWCAAQLSNIQHTMRGVMQCALVRYIS